MAERSPEQLLGRRRPSRGSCLRVLGRQCAAKHSAAKRQAAFVVIGSTDPEGSLSVSLPLDVIGDPLRLGFGLPEEKVAQLGLRQSGRHSAIASGRRVGDGGSAIPLFLSHCPYSRFQSSPKLICQLRSAQNL